MDTHHEVIGHALIGQAHYDGVGAATMKPSIQVSNMYFRIAGINVIRTTHGVKLSETEMNTIPPVLQNKEDLKIQKNQEMEKSLKLPVDPSK